MIAAIDQALTACDQLDLQAVEDVAAALEAIKPGIHGKGPTEYSVERV